MPGAVERGGVGRGLTGAVSSVAWRHGAGTVAAPVNSVLHGVGAGGVAITEQGFLAWGGGHGPSFGSRTSSMPSSVDRAPPAGPPSTSGEGWAFDLTESLPTGTEGAYSLNTAFNQGRWIAEIDGSVWWVYAVGGTSNADLYGEVVLTPVPARKVTTRGGAPVPETVRFSDPGFNPTLVVPPPGTSDVYMVAYVGELASRAIPLKYAWNPTASSASLSSHAPSASVDGVVTTRCGYPAGVITEDGAQAFVAYTLSDLMYSGDDSDEDPTRRVRLLRLPADGGPPEDFEVEPDPGADGFSHSHFPSVAVSSYSIFGVPLAVVMVVWRSFYTAGDVQSAIRGRVYIFDADGNVWDDAGPFDVGSDAEGGVYGSDPSVIGIGDGDFLVAFQAQSSSDGTRGSVHTRTCSIPGPRLGDLVRVEPDGSTGTEATFPHKFPSLAINAAKDRVLMAYEVGIGGPDETHGTRVAAMLLADPTTWTTMPLSEGDGDGVCDPTAKNSLDGCGSATEKIAHA